MCWQLWYIIDRGFEPRLGHTKDYKIGICCFSAKHAALRRKSKDWLVRNQNNVSEWNHMSTRGLLFQWASTIKFQLSCWSSTKHTSSSSHWKLTCSHHDTAEELLNWRHTKITHSITDWSRHFLLYFPKLPNFPSMFLWGFWRGVVTFWSDSKSQDGHPMSFSNGKKSHFSCIFFFFGCAHRINNKFIYMKWDFHQNSTRVMEKEIYFICMHTYIKTNI